MKVVYVPGPGEPEETEAFGRLFVSGEAVEISDEKMLEKMRGNPYFKIGNEKPDREAGDAVQREDEKRLTKALDGRTKAAREARAKADEAEAEAAAAERAQTHVQQIAESRNSPDK